MEKDCSNCEYLSILFTEFQNDELINEAKHNCNECNKYYSNWKQRIDENDEGDEYSEWT